MPPSACNTTLRLSAIRAAAILALKKREEIPVGLEEVHGDHIVDKEIDEIAQSRLAALKGDLELVRPP